MGRPIELFQNTDDLFLTGVAAQGAVRRKKRGAEFIGTFTMNCPLLLPSALVVGNQTTGGFRLVAKYKFQSLAQAGQFMFRVLDCAVTRDNPGLGRNIPMGAELPLTLQPFAAATS